MDVRIKIVSLSLCCSHKHKMILQALKIHEICGGFDGVCHSFRNVLSYLDQVTHYAFITTHVHVPHLCFSFLLLLFFCSRQSIKVIL